MIPERVLLTADAVGGVWTYAADLARALASGGIDVTLANLGPPPSAGQAAAVAVTGVRLVDTGADLDWLAPDASALARAGEAIASLASAESVDVAHLNTPALAAAIRFPCPIVAVAHSSLGTWWDAVEAGPVPPDFAWRDDLTRAGLIAADVTVAPSAAFADTLARVHRLPHRPRVVHNGRGPIAPSAGEPVAAVFTAGRLWDRGKDVATLDRAAARLPVTFGAAGPTIGPNGDRLTVTHLACVGSLSAADLATSLAERPVFASAALYEPFGLAVLEAAQTGCALVLADTPVFRELWDGAALFVTPRDADGFADACGRLLSDPVERVRRGRDAAERAHRYSLDAMRDATLRTYAEAMTGHKGRAAA